MYSVSIRSHLGNYPLTSSYELGRLGVFSLVLFVKAQDHPGMYTRICLRGLLNPSKRESCWMRRLLWLMAEPAGKGWPYGGVEEGQLRGGGAGSERVHTAVRALWLPWLLWFSIWGATDLERIKSSQLPRNTLRPASVMGKPRAVTGLFVGLSVV